MKLSKHQLTLNKLMMPVVVTMGYCYVGCDCLVQGRYMKVRVYIDHGNGITTNDCQKVSRQLQALLTVEAPITQSCVLEVSSPGIERPLFTLAHFKQAIGKKILVKCFAPVANRRRMIGDLCAVEDKQIVLAVDNEKVAIAFVTITKANVVAVW